MSRNVVDLGLLAACRCRRWAARPAPRRRAPCVCFVAAPSQTGLCVSLTMPYLISAGWFRDVQYTLRSTRPTCSSVAWSEAELLKFVCVGLAAIDVPAAETIASAATGTARLPERVSIASLLDVVSDDLLKLNNNLKSVSAFSRSHSLCLSSLKFALEKMHPLCRQL